MIRIVTDSACDLPDGIAETLGISIVPLYINLCGQSFIDIVEISRDEFYQRLPACEQVPTTSAPSPASFRKVYEQLVADGASDIISIHISTSLSRTIDSAREAAAMANHLPITVVDSDQLSLGAGYVVMAAARAAVEGKTKEEILNIISEVSKRTYVFAALETLHYLSKSGRMHVALARIGTILKIKPLLKMNRGKPEAERVRTNEGAVRRLMRLVEDLGPLEKLSLVHTYAYERIENLYQRAKHLFPETDDLPDIVSVSPVLGSHLGPGVIGFTAIIKES
ncbi:MAG: DegV family protein [Anaerolineaceae bacterium]|nr:DegV family protein [Anaerolineaceae bacterium]